MTRAYFLVSVFLLISINLSGQCSNSPTVTLSSISGTTCGTTTITVDGNTFGGSATRVNITEDGAGSVTPVSSNASPFSFRYTPRNSDVGKDITITVTTDNPLGLPCAAAQAIYTLTVSAKATAPVVGTITQPTCALPTGSVILNGLPSTGTWIVTRTPGQVTNEGTGTSTTISGIPSGTFTFNVTNDGGCTSPESANVVISSQPVFPATPTQTVDCSLGPGKADITVTAPLGTGLQYRLDAGVYQSGRSFLNVADGNHTISVRNSSGCITTGSSFLVACTCSNPPTLTLSSNSGSSCGKTSFKVSGNTFGGSATSVTITTNGTGTVSPPSTSIQPFDFTYTPSDGDLGSKVIITITTDNPLGLPCLAASDTYVLTANASPTAPLIGVITQPTCSSLTGSVILNGLPLAGSWTVTRTPGGVITTGSGSSSTISGLAFGTYTFTVANSIGCTSVASANTVINPPLSLPGTPIIGTITQPTCSVSTGSVNLTGLPSTGTWTLIRSPGAVTTTGTGASATITNLTAGTYTYTVTNSAGCTSLASGNIEVSTQPVIPSAPVVGAITAPTCSLSTGSVILSGLPATGTWALTRYPGAIATNGTGPSITISGLSAGIYNYSLTSTFGCVSALSANVNIPAQPLIPSPPLIGTIIQPTNDIPTGSVELDGLPATGTWTLIMTPGSITTTGSGTTTTISGLAGGTYSLTVTSSAGCVSAPSANFGIFTSTGVPTIVINNPAPVCFPSTVDLTNPLIVAGSTLNLTYTYWTNIAATSAYNSPSAATEGIYYIKGTTGDGFFSIKSVTVTVYSIPVANAGPDQLLSNKSETTMDALLANDYETGIWSLISGAAEFVDPSASKTIVNGLSLGKDMLLWTVSNGVCPTASDTIMINVSNLAMPTLITPNMDGKNDYFVIKRSDKEGKIELVIFDRRGVQVYKNSNYDNSWNGVDYKGKALQDDTYFFVLKIENGISATGYIVVRR